MELDARDLGEQSSRTGGHGSPFLVDDARVQRLAATRAGRLSLGGYAYQGAYVVARLAAMLAERPILDAPDVPARIRFDWAEDVDEVLSDGSVVFTQCKKGEVLTPKALARIMLGFAPKLLWATAPSRIRFRLVIPERRLGRGPMKASNALSSKWPAVCDAALSELAADPPPQSDRALWMADVADQKDLVRTIWERLELLPVSDEVPPFDPAGLVLYAEREALNALLAMQHIDPARQRESMATLRTLVHADVIGFDPAGSGAAEVPIGRPRVNSREDVAVAMSSFARVTGGNAPYLLVDRTYLDAQARMTKRQFVARFPSWADVVHGEDEAIGFVDRDETDALRRLVREVLIDPSRRSESTIPVLLVTGAPGSGKTTITRRVAALMALARECVVADFGRSILVGEDPEAVVASLDRIASLGRPVLMLLDDPLFADSPWPDLLARLSGPGRNNISVLAATPDVLHDRFASALPRGVRTHRWGLGRASDGELRRLERMHGRHSRPSRSSRPDFLVAAMEITAGERFDEIIDGIWRATNDGVALSPTALPAELPWLVRAYLIVAYFHRYYLETPEVLLKAALREAESGPTSTLDYRVNELATSRGWKIFARRPGSGRLGTTHALVARAAWARRPNVAFDPSEWIVPASIRRPDTAGEVGRLFATIMAADAPEAERAVRRLARGWAAAVAAGDIDPHAVVALVSAGAAVDHRFAEPFRSLLVSCLDSAGPQAWVAALPLLRSRSPTGGKKSDHFPALERALAVADIKENARRAAELLALLPPGSVARQSLVRRVRAAMDDDRSWSPPNSLLFAWLEHSGDDEAMEAVDTLLERLDYEVDSLGRRRQIIALAGTKWVTEAVQTRSIAIGLRWVADDPEDGEILRSVLGAARATLLPPESHSKVVRAATEWLRRHPEDRTTRKLLLAIARLGGLDASQDGELRRSTLQWLEEHPGDTVTREAMLRLAAERGLSAELAEELFDGLIAWLESHPGDEQTWGHLAHHGHERFLSHAQRVRLGRLVLERLDSVPDHAGFRRAALLMVGRGQLDATTAEAVANQTLVWLGDTDGEREVRRLLFRAALRGRLPRRSELMVEQSALRWHARSADLLRLSPEVCGLIARSTKPDPGVCVALVNRTLLHLGSEADEHGVRRGLLDLVAARPDVDAETRHRPVIETLQWLDRGGDSSEDLLLALINVVIELGKSALSTRAEVIGRTLRWQTKNRTTHRPVEALLRAAAAGSLNEDECELVLGAASELLTDLSRRSPLRDHALVVAFRAHGVLPSAAHLVNRMLGWLETTPDDVGARQELVVTAARAELPGSALEHLLTPVLQWLEHRADGTEVRQPLLGLVVSGRHGLSRQFADRVLSDALWTLDVPNGHPAIRQQLVSYALRRKLSPSQSDHVLANTARWLELNSDAHAVRGQMLKAAGLGAVKKQAATALLSAMLSRSHERPDDVSIRQDLLTAALSEWADQPLSGEILDEVISWSEQHPLRTILDQLLSAARDGALAPEQVRRVARCVLDWGLADAAQFPALIEAIGRFGAAHADPVSAQLVMDVVKGWLDRTPFEHWGRPELERVHGEIWDAVAWADAADREPAP